MTPPEWGRTLADDAGALRSVLDGMAEAVVVADAAGRLVYFNPAAEQLHGIGLTGEPPEGWGKRYGIFLEDGVTPCPAEQVPLYRAIRGDGPDHVGLYVRRPDGTGCLVEVTGRPIRDDRRGAVLGGVVVFGDVTWRKEAERRLRESQDRLRRTLDGLLEGCTVIGFDWTYLFVNQAAAAYGREAREPIVGRKVQEVYPGIERSEVFAAYRRCMEERVPQRFESEYVFGDGSAGWYEFSVEPVPEGIFVLSLDITERKRAEEQLRATSRYGRGLIEASLDPLVTISAEGKITDVNAATEAVTGVARADLIGSDFSDYFTEPEKARAGYQAVFAQGTVRDFPLTIRHRSGTTTDVLYDATVYRNDQGEVQGVFAAARDVTERKRAEEQLKASSAYARGLIEASLDPLVTISAEGKITDVNAATETVTGVPRAHLVGSDFCDYFTEPERARAGYRAVFAQGLVRDYPLTIRHQSGTTTDVLYNATVYRNARGEVGGVFAAARDITERVRLEQQLRQAQRMEALGQLAGGIAHGFNNLLTVIHANVGLLQTELPEDTGALEDLRDLQRAATRGQEMVKKLLGFARQESLKLTRADLGELIGDVVTTLRILLPETVELKLTTSRPLPAVRADIGSLEQILINLATNARDAMPEGGTLAIDVGCREVDAVEAAARSDLAPGRYVAVTVSDSGEGMDEHTLRHAYEPFFTTKPVGQGTGLGIPLVYGLMKQHGGYLHITSERGQGTTVHLLFPAEEGPAAPRVQREPTRQAARGGSETILVVEDEAELRRAACRILNRFGYRTLAAADGDEALAIYREHRGSIDLIFSDLVMPKLGGVELLERIRADDPGVRFLIASGYSSGEARGSGMKKGVPFVNKPWTLPELLYRIRDALDAPVE